MPYSSNFKNDWYGWLTNQWSHTLLGILSYSIAMLASFFILGEYASRTTIFVAVLIAYVGWEIITTGKRMRWDALEDLIFVCGYGAGSIAIAVHEIEAGSSVFTGDLQDLAPLQGLFVVHSILGVIFRLIGRQSE